MIQDIDTIPFPAWHLVPFRETYFKVKNTESKLELPIGYVITTRGCPYKCTFCYHPFNNRKIRMHSPGRVIDEIKYLAENYKIKTVQFADDLFFSKKSNAFEILDLMDKEKINLKWRAACRVNLIDEELVKRVKSSGCIELGIGVESGNQTILDNINKKNTVQDAERALTLCKKYNINYVASYMIGNVGETKETVRDTVNFRKKYNPGMGGFFFATPYPDTELYNYALSHNLIKDELALIKSYGEQNEKILVNFTNMTDSELQNLKKSANKELILDYLKKHPFKAGCEIGKSLLKKYLKNLE
jgi:anaerobic magnesium-protoporphyrin IX monomethyl ester cyclase